MKKSVIILLIAFVVLFHATSASAMTDAEQSALIQQLTQQLTALQAQLNQLLAAQGGQGLNQGWCHTFSTNLKLGDTNDDVTALNIALGMQGFVAGSGNYFSGTTQSAVVAFQERYASEILSPLKLTQGTGVVGAATRAELNQFYQCAPLTILYPKGGEILTVGDTARITWQASGFAPSDTLSLSVYMPNNPYVNIKTIAASVAASKGYFDWNITAASLPSTSYPVVLSVKIASQTKNISISSNNFTVNSANAQGTSYISIIYPAGGETFNFNPQHNIGDTPRISWSASGFSSGDFLNITVHSTSSPYVNIKTIASSVLASQGYFDWHISNATLPVTTGNVSLFLDIQSISKGISITSNPFNVNIAPGQ